MRPIKKAFVTILGLVVIALGIVLIPLPGPGSLVILGGLAMLGSEYEPPRRWVAALRQRMRRSQD